ncbi:MAG: hypothetical protein LBM98_03675 [Oscillospiraceae bacterium]|nr:hypothetical protein [Oscillospiraceae bacterium]
MRYVPLRPARQSSAGSITYVCFAPGTGLLRTCNIVRIASLPVLRKDGARRRDVGRGTRNGGRRTGEGGFETRPYVPPQPSSKPIVSDI